jgi:hypothetical protein
MQSLGDLGKVATQSTDLRLESADHLAVVQVQFVQVSAEASGPHQSNNCDHGNRDDQTAKQHNDQFHASSQAAKDECPIVERLRRPVLQ